MTNDSFADFDVPSCRLHDATKENDVDAWFKNGSTTNGKQLPKRRKPVDKTNSILHFDPSEPPAQKRTKLTKPTVMVPTQKPFYFSTPKAMKPRPFVFSEVDEEVIFKGNLDPPTNNKKTISMARLNRLAQPRRRHRPVEVVAKPVTKAKSIAKVQAMLAKEPDMTIRYSKEPTVPVGMKLSTEERAETWRVAKAERVKMAIMKEEANALEEAKRNEEEQLLMNEYRAGLIQVASAIRQYKPVKKVKPKPTTVPMGPTFQTAKRKRT